MSPFITVGNARFLNVPHAAEVLDEIVAQDCYRLDSIPDGSLVIDVGAFYGEFGIICYKNKNCNVVAYEPARENYRIATYNAELNSCNRSVRYCLNHMAVGGSSGWTEFFYRSDHPAGSLIDGSKFGVSENVQTTTLIRAIKSPIVNRGIHESVVVKLDCEGSEVDIFNNDLEWLALTNIVTMEWHNHDGDVYAKILEENGFTVELEGGGPKPRPKWDKSLGGGLLFAKRK